MRVMCNQFNKRTAISAVLLSLFLLLSCSACGSHSGVDLRAFKKLARAGECADLRNDLYLIDGRLVFWDREGNCSDAAYAQELFGSTPGQVLCKFHDSIAGPVKTCDAPAYEDLFSTITENLDKPDLGLGPEHTVERVLF